MAKSRRKVTWGKSYLRSRGRQWRSYYRKPLSGKRIVGRYQQSMRTMGEALAHPESRIAGQGFPEPGKITFQGQVILDPGDFVRRIRRLTRKLGPEQVCRVAADLAWYLITTARKSPIPRDTGLLSRSGNVEVDVRRMEVIFGFNTPYALDMDVGTSEMPPKSYGSDVGPNLYFTETLRLKTNFVYSEIVRKLDAMARST